MSDTTRGYVRHEHFGAVLYDPRTGRYLHVSHDATARIDADPACWPGRGPSGSDAPRQLTHIRNPRVREGVLSAPLKAFFNITKRCNLHCTHCYNSSGEPDSPELELPHVLATLRELERRGVFKVTLAGGEPLVHRDIDAILSALHGSDLWVTLITNGLRLTDRVASALAATDSMKAVTVSIDGATPEAHDQVRGPHTFARAMDGLVRLRRRFDRPVSVRVTLMQPNIDGILALPRQLVAMGIDELKVNRVNPYGRARSNPALLLDESAYAGTLEALLEECARLGLRLEVPAFKYKTTIGNQEGLCRAGEETCEIDGDGGVYPCSFCFGRFLAGHVQHGCFDDIFAALQRHSINNEWCYGCRGRGGRAEKTVGYVPKLIEVAEVLAH
jgi:MoaA/NifB/PqqE/SkfB family radical SAM enzyme